MTLALVHRERVEAPAVEPETIEMLEELLRRARRGEISGLAAITWTGPSTYRLEALCGDACRDLTHTLGAVRIFEADLSVEILSEAGVL